MKPKVSFISNLKLTQLVPAIIGIAALQIYASEENGNNNVVLNQDPAAFAALVNSEAYKNAYGIPDSDLETSALYFSGSGNNNVTGIIPKQAQGPMPIATPNGRLFTQPQLTLEECSSSSMSSNPHQHQKSVSDIPGITAADLSGRGDIYNGNRYSINREKIFEDKIEDNHITVITPSTPSREIQKALDCASQERKGDTKGGIVYFEPGNYLISELFLRSNLRVVIDKNATFFLPANSRNLFNIGRNIIRAQDWLETDPETGRMVENVEIAVAGSSDNRFTINLKGADENGFCGLLAADPDNGGAITNIVDRDFNRNANAFLVGFAKNFAISGAKIIDNYTINPSVFLVTDTDGQIGNRSWQGVFYPNPYQNRAPSFGVVQDIDATGVSTNYATLQLFAGENILIKNLTANDGITVRLEPGRSEDPLNQAGPFFGAIKNVELDDLRIENGFTAVFIQPHAKIFEDVVIKDIKAIDSAAAVFTETSELPTQYLEPNRVSDGGRRTYQALADIQDSEVLRTLNLPMPGQLHNPIFHRNAELFYKRGKVDGPGLVLDGTVVFMESFRNHISELLYFAQTLPSQESRNTYQQFFRNGEDVCVFDANVAGTEFNYPDITPASRVFLQKTWLNQIAERQLVRTTELRNRGELNARGFSDPDLEIPFDFGRRRHAIPEPIAPILAAGTFNGQNINDNVLNTSGFPLDHSESATGRYGMTFGSKYRVLIPPSSLNRITTYNDPEEFARLSGPQNSVLYRNRVREFGGSRASEPAVNRVYNHLEGATLREVRSAVRRSIRNGDLGVFDNNISLEP